ncbi:hypothetical protein JB92DRAFT_2824363 [Gautieria morchelliformis]|nr:hypothetical protein JB92DRAFT_2824363 [Gautieria morchelliformis]
MSSSYSESILAMRGAWSEGWRVYNVITRVRKTRVYDERGSRGKQVFERVSRGESKFGASRKGRDTRIQRGILLLYSIWTAKTPGPLPSSFTFRCSGVATVNALAWLTGRMMTIDTIHAVKKYAISHVRV